MTDDLADDPSVAPTDTSSDRAGRRVAMDREARIALAQSRLRLRWERLCFFAAVLMLALVYVPAAWVVGCAAAVAAGELLERWAAGGLLAAPAARAGPAWRGFVAASLVTASATSLVIVVLWVFAAPDQRLFPLGVLFITTFYLALANPQVGWLLMLRQGLFAGLAAALALRDMVLAGPLTGSGLITGLLPVLAFAAYVVAMSRWSAWSYRRQLEQMHALAETRDEAEGEREAKARLIATISHELRTPLNGVIGMAQTLLADGLTPNQRRQVEVIAESGRNLNALLNDILDFSKIEAGQLAITPAEDDLHRTITHVEALYRPLSEQKGLALEIGVDPAVPARLVFDAVRVRQCLSNLLSNAIKFTEVGAVRLAVSAEPASPAADGGARWRIVAEVSDTGIGIAAEHQQRLFTPFAQAHGSITRRYGGTGLGLSITRYLAEAMGGGITVESAPGEGATFRLGFLAGAAGPGADRGAEGPESPAEGGPELAGRRVLVADDAATNRMVLRLFLQPMGVEVVEAADGRAALEALGRGRYDAAFIDLYMPGLGGPELAGRVRRGEAGPPDLPLVAVTGTKDDQATTRCGGAFDAQLIKPIDPDALRETLRQVLASGGAPEANPDTNPDTNPGTNPGARRRGTAVSG